jgi:hypothetical protein
MVEEGHDDLRRASGARQFLDKPSPVVHLSTPMRREMQIRVAFEPTRLSAEYLRRAYEIVLPLVERTVTKAAENAAPPEGRTRSVAQRRQRRES